MAWMYLYIVACALGAAVAQSETDSIFASLPPELAGKFNQTQVEGLKDKYVDQFKKKCEQNGHPEVFENAQTALSSFMNCYNSLVDMNVLQKEIEDAKPTGKVDEVFKKYCNKAPEFKQCFGSMIETVKSCFSAEEQKNFKTLYNVTEQLTEFICYKDGDRIALFIAEGGQECLDDKKEDIQNCFSQVYDSENQQQVENITSFDGIMQLEFKEKQCNQISELQTCVVGALESCPKPTSSNIIDSLFNFARKSTPCKAFMKQDDDVESGTSKSQTEKTTKAGAGRLDITVATIVTAIATAILL